VASILSQVQTDKTTRTESWPKFSPRRYRLSTCPVMFLVPRRCLQYFLSFCKAASVMPVANSRGKFVISQFLERDIDSLKRCCLTEWSCKRCCYLKCVEPFRPICVPRNSRSALLLGYPVSSVGTRHLLIQGNIFYVSRS